MEKHSALYREPSDGMKKMYQEKKDRTCKKVRDAIHLIKNEGRRVTKKELFEITGLSPATFSKEYIKEILKDEQVCQFRVIKQAGPTSNELKTIEILSRDLEQLKHQKQDLELENESIKQRLDQLSKINSKNEEDLKLLEGRYQQALEYLEVLGADLSKLPVF